MENDFSRFEKHGLKIDQERVLTYSKLRCPLDCTYCFVDDMRQEQMSGVKYLEPAQLDLLGQLPEQVKLIMLGCDTEFFQNKKEALEILQKLSELKKDVSVITKLALPREYLIEISKSARVIFNNGNIFTFSTSLPCLSDAMLAKYEPKVPSPERRIKMLQELHELGVETMLAVRPLLSDVSDEELEEIISRTKEFCFGYYSGPLYLKEDRIKLLLPEYLTDDKKENQPHWMLEGNSYRAIERPKQMKYLEKIVKKNDRLFFDGAASGTAYLRNKRKYDQSGDKM